MFLFELFQLGFAKAQAFEFFELIAEQLMARALFVAGVGESLQFQAGLAPALGGQENLAGEVCGTGVFIEQARVGGSAVKVSSFNDNSSFNGTCT